MEMIEKIYTLLETCNFKISTDTRKIETDSLFFALKGDNFNGNTFALTALANGAKYAVIDETVAEDERLLKVNDVLICLQQLANYHRKQLSTQIIAITGSNGKTTSKELMYAVLKAHYKVFATKGNLNNHIGVPLSLLAIQTNDDFAIIEMGANHQKEIEQLCAIAEPDFGIINNIGKAHLEGFGGEEGVKKGKGEMYDYIRKTNKKVFVNGDDTLLMEMSQDLKRTVFGSLKDYFIFGKITNDKGLLEITVEQIDTVQTQLIGDYNFSNVLLAACIGKYFHVPMSKIKQAIENYAPTNSRSQLIKKEKNTIILDAYNANPSSMESAIRNFGQSEFKHKIVVLGDMFELGIYSYQEHQHILEITEAMGFEACFFCGPFFKGSKTIKNNSFLFSDVPSCEAAIKGSDFENKTILIKGSRSMALEKLVEVIG
jgi:UDP-N-acetylmuramoyl-tripeptide--D-alanyl-D-alanine ligase